MNSCSSFVILGLFWEGVKQHLSVTYLQIQVLMVLLITSRVRHQPDGLNSISTVWCAEAPEVWANSSVYTPESLSQTKTNTFIGFQVLVCCDCPIALKFLIALCCLLIHALSLPRITMGYSVRIILAWYETMYESSIRCVNSSQHTSYIQYAAPLSPNRRGLWSGSKIPNFVSVFWKHAADVRAPPALSVRSVCWKSLTQAVAFAGVPWDMD